MTEISRIDRLQIPVGGLARAELRSALASRSVLLNVHAEALLDAGVFDRQDTRLIAVTERTVADLGRPHGASLSEILKLGQEQGLMLCPPDTGPLSAFGLGRPSDIGRLGDVHGKGARWLPHHRVRTVERRRLLSQGLLSSCR